MSSISGAEFAATRKLLGLSAAELATELGVVLRTIQRWESGSQTPSEGVLAELGALRGEHDALVETLMVGVEEEKQIALPRGDATRPQGWYLAVAARILDRDPDAWIGWDDES